MNIDIKRIAELAMLSIDDDKAGAIADDMRALVKMVSELPDCGEQTADAGEMELRDDKVIPSACTREELLMNAPQTEGNCFAVPRTVEH